MATLENDSDLYKMFRTWIYIYNKCRHDYETSFQLMLPTIMFTDNLILDMGDLKIELVYFGPGYHTASDILVSIPDENIVFIGDILLPGDQYYRVTSKSKFDPWVSSLDKILRNNNKLKSVVSIHAGILPGSVLRDFHDSLETMRNEQRQKRSAIDNLRSMISASSVQQAVNKFEDRFLKNRNEEYFIWEGDLYSLAKEFQEKGKSDEAILILKTCEKMFPNAVNALFLLGRIFMETGKKQPAIETFKKILSIDPLEIFALDLVYQLENSK